MCSSKTEAKLLQLLDRVGSERRSIDRITLSQYQITFAVDDLEFGLYTFARLSVREQGEEIVLQADWRDRDKSSYAVCRVIGRVVEHVRFTADGLELDLGDFGVLTIQRIDGSESYYIHAPSAGGTFIY